MKRLFKIALYLLISLSFICCKCLTCKPFEISEDSRHKYYEWYKNICKDKNLDMAISYDIYTQSFKAFEVRDNYKLNELDTISMIPIREKDRYSLKVYKDGGFIQEIEELWKRKVKLYKKDTPSDTLPSVPPSDTLLETTKTVWYNGIIGNYTTIYTDDTNIVCKNDTTCINDTKYKYSNIKCDTTIKDITINAIIGYNSKGDITFIDTTFKAAEVKADEIKDTKIKDAEFKDTKIKDAEFKDTKIKYDKSKEPKTKGLNIEIEKELSKLAKAKAKAEAKEKEFNLAVAQFHETKEKLKKQSKLAKEKEKELRNIKREKKYTKEKGRKQSEREKKQSKLAEAKEKEFNLAVAQFHETKEKLKKQSKLAKEKEKEFNLAVAQFHETKEKLKKLQAELEKTQNTINLITKLERLPFTDLYTTLHKTVEKDKQDKAKIYINKKVSRKVSEELEHYHKERGRKIISGSDYMVLVDSDNNKILRYSKFDKDGMIKSNIRYKYNKTGDKLNIIQTLYGTNPNGLKFRNEIFKEYTNIKYKKCR